MQNNGKNGVDIPLELVADYPIKWDFQKVLRDFIQNFYDALGPDKFGSEFYYDYDTDGLFFTLVMSAEGQPFSHELLSYKSLPQNCPIKIAYATPPQLSLLALNIFLNWLMGVGVTVPISKVADGRSYVFWT